MDPALIQSYLKQTRIVRAPKRLLTAFGATTLHYHLVSPVEDMKDRTRLREGKVLSEKPRILTPESLAERFEGFGEEARQFAQWLAGAYPDLLRALEYHFKNQGFATRVISDGEQEVAARIAADLDSREVKDQAVIRCPDAAWSLALMKFTLDESARSFPTHVRDLERRGLFDPAGKLQDRRRREIERLFEAAPSDPEALMILGRKLKDYGLFAEYEDRFLRLF